MTGATALAAFVLQRNVGAGTEKSKKVAGRMVRPSSAVGSRPPLGRTRHECADYGRDFTELVLKTLINIPELEEVTVYFKWNFIVNDPDDDKFVDAAVASNADYVITHDGDFKVLRKIEFPTVRCISLREFHEIWFGVPMPDLQR